MSRSDVEFAKMPVEGVVMQRLPEEEMPVVAAFAFPRSYRSEVDQRSVSVPFETLLQLGELAREIAALQC
jgi:hypothetical protein